MAVKGEDGAARSGESVETKIGADPTTSVGEGAKARTTDAAGSVVEIDEEGIRTRTGLRSSDDNEGDDDAATAGDAPVDGDEPAEGEDAEGEDTEGEDAEGEDTEGEDAEGEGDGGPDLGEFNEGDPESVARYEAHFVTEEGQFRVDRLSEEWFRNAGDDLDKGTLSEGTYAFLENSGFSREDIKALEEGQKALARQGANAVAEMAGGKEALDAAVKWGVEGGYSEAQKARFNAAMSDSDPEVRADAIEALMARFEKAGGKVPDGGTSTTQGRRRRTARAASPQRDVTARGGTGATGPAPFASRAEYSKAFREARQEKDSAKVAEVRARLKASPWYGRSPR